jgi:tetratricopeptide (TPR) repeat protein
MSHMPRLKINILFIVLAGLPMLLFSQSSGIFYALSQDEFKKADFPNALISINKAIQTDSLNADYFLLRAKLKFNLIKYDDAIKDCYASLKLKPENPEVYFLRGQICIVTASYGGAILFFGKTIKNTNNKELLYNAYVNLGKALTELGKYDDAYTNYMAAVQLFPDETLVLLPLAENYYKRKLTSDALTTLNKAVQKLPDEAGIYVLYGLIYMENKDYKQAIETLNKYCNMVTNDPKALSMLAVAYYETKDLQNALISINRAITLNPSDPANYKIKGSILFEKGQTEEGCNCTFKAMQLGYLEKYSYDLLDVYIQKCENK